MIGRTVLRTLPDIGLIRSSRFLLFLSAIAIFLLEFAAGTTAVSKNAPFPAQEQFILDGLAKLCAAKCPDFCKDPESLECSELTLDPCGCCMVCLRNVGEPCGAAVGSCRYPDICQPQSNQEDIGVCVGEFAYSFKISTAFH
ncbi:unnamed protein product [Gongylonema pulchrum]|uniref:IGFBP N-terminal domain-containing protein n=1 Tax=Gongylonema pulchrum TaxID=637853 RepID=A0A183E0B9_9BILA|nr:unnamed protein product [Gongylonema pulchrum]